MVGTGCGDEDCRDRERCHPTDGLAVDMHYDYRDRKAAMDVAEEWSSTAAHAAAAAAAALSGGQGGHGAEEEAVLVASTR